MSPKVRLNKRLADLGLASRRGAEELILAGKVKVNGVVVTELATKVDPETDKVEVDAAALKPQGPRGYLLNKPVGYVCTKGEEEGPTILDLLPPPAAGMAYAGRLDKDSRGLVLMLADGRLNYALTAPETHLEKEYEILAETEPKESQLLRMAEGMTLDGERTRPARVEPIKGKRFHLGITEGKNRQIRRMCSKVGIEVMDLCRLAIGPLELGDLPEGKWKELTSAQEEMLRRSVKKRP